MRRKKTKKLVCRIGFENHAGDFRNVVIRLPRGAGFKRETVIKLLRARGYDPAIIRTEECVPYPWLHKGKQVHLPHKRR